MRQFKPKQCPHCGTSFTPTGSNHKFCSKKCQYDSDILDGTRKEYRDRAYAKRGSVVGIGSGGLTGTGPKNHMFSHGRYAFRNYARKLKLLGVPCHHCGKDLRTATRGEWVGHHIDHNPQNNNLNNLMMLCKPCHHYHHETYRNLPQLKNVQRLERNLVENSVLEAQSPTNVGDDIV